MDTNSLLLILPAVAASAFFSGMEIAFVSANKLKIELSKKQGDLSGKFYSRFMKVPGKFITSMLLGNNIALVVYGIAMGALLTELLSGFITSAGVLLIVQTILSTGIILIFAEFLPKTLFSKNPNGALKLFSAPVVLYYYLMYPVVHIVSAISNLILKYVMRVSTNSAKIRFGMVDLDHLVKEATSSSDDADELDAEVQIFQNALDFSNVKTRECMIPRTEIVAFEVHDSVEDLHQKFIETGYSKIIIYRDNIDNAIGYVHSSEMFKKPDSIKSVTLPVSVVPESMPANELLEMLISKKRSIAIVLDEFGGTAGLVTIEDVIEEIFGDIEDEHDTDELTELKISETSFRFSGRLEVDYLNENYNLHIPESEDYETLAGFIISQCESIPEEHEIIETDEFEIKILKSEAMRIDEVKLKVKTS